MSNLTWEEWRSEIAETFHGRWQNVLPSLGCEQGLVDALFAKKRNSTCPVCSRKAKFYMRDTQTAKSICCHQECKYCAFDGIALAKELGGYRSERDVCLKLEELYPQELKHVIERNRGKSSNKMNSSYSMPRYTQKPSAILNTPVNKPQLNPKAAAQHEKLISEIHKLDDESATLAVEYIRDRGLDPELLMPYMKNALFFHKNLNYYHVIEGEDGEDDEVHKGFYPAIVAQILGRNGKTIGFHRIYLDKRSGKANVPEAKKLVSPLYLEGYSNMGCIVKLTEPDVILGICEGIETGLGIIQAGHPCWPLVDAYKFNSFVPPKGVKVLNIFGDLDTSMTGQNVMMDLYLRLKVERPEIQVNMLLPPSKFWDKEKKPKGIDFLDAFNLGYTLPEKYRILPHVIEEKRDVG